MATVHLGRLLGPVGFSRTVAIKRLHAHFVKDPQFVAMFLDEAHVAARIRHPNVVPTLDVVALEGELFLVMEYVQGEALSRLNRLARAEGKFVPPEFAAAIMVAVLNGLHAAHEATSERGEPLEIVHRDVSPHNILVGIDGVARVLDFGVAKAAGRVQSTRQGQLKGKLAYMPPEQIRGTVDRTTDVYSCGVVLWETLTGRRLFNGDNEAVVFSRVLEAVVEPPSKYAPGIPPALDALILRSLDRDPSKRFPTARDMARALEKSLPLVPATDVGEWVERLAGKSLADRAARIARIESQSSVDVQASMQMEQNHTPVPASTGTDASWEAAPSGHDERMVTALSSSSLVEAGSTAGIPGKRAFRGTLMVAAGIACVVIASVAFGLRDRKDENAAATVHAPSSEQVAPPPEAVRVDPAPPPVPLVAPAAPPVTAAVTSPAASSAAPARRPVIATKQNEQPSNRPSAPNATPPSSKKGISVHESVLDSRH